MKTSIQHLLCAASLVAIGSLAACKTTKTVVIEETTTTVNRSSKPKTPADPGVNLEPVRKPATFSPSY
jgi:hypothetical protein